MIDSYYVDTYYEYKTLSSNEIELSEEQEKEIDGLKLSIITRK